MEEQQQLQQELSGKIESINLFEVQTEVLGFNPVNFVDEFINSSSIEIYKLADELQYWMERSILPHIKNNNNDDDNERNIEQQGSDHGNEETNQAEDDNAIKDSSLDENDRSKKRKISSFSNKSRDDNQASSRKSHTLTKEDKLHAATQKWLTKLEKRMDKAFDRWEIYILRNLGKTKTPYIWPTDQDPPRKISDEEETKLDLELKEIQSKLSLAKQQHTSLSYSILVADKQLASSTEYLTVLQKLIKPCESLALGETPSSFFENNNKLLKQINETTELALLCQDELSLDRCNQLQQELIKNRGLFSSHTTGDSNNAMNTIQDDYMINNKQISLDQIKVN